MEERLLTLFRELEKVESNIQEYQEMLQSVKDDAENLKRSIVKEIVYSDTKFFNLLQLNRREIRKVLYPRH